MKVAIAVDKGKVSAHFGRCEEFVLLEIEDSKVISKKMIKNPGHKPGFLPQFLKELKVDVIITGGMGKKALELFEKAQIKVILGITGEVEDVINEFLKGNLKSKESLCTRDTFKETEVKYYKEKGSKICITSKGDSLNSELDPSFGRCNYFIIFDLESSDYEAIENPYKDLPQGAGIKSAQFVIEKNVDTLLTGEVGPHAQEVLQKGGVNLIKRISGRVREVIEAFKKGGPNYVGQ